MIKINKHLCDELNDWRYYIEEVPFEYEGLKFKDFHLKGREEYILIGIKFCPFCGERLE